MKMTFGLFGNRKKKVLQRSVLLFISADLVWDRNVQILIYMYVTTGCLKADCRVYAEPDSVSGIYVPVFGWQGGETHLTFPLSFNYYTN
jgi:hypothetical protein